MSVETEMKAIEEAEAAIKAEPRLTKEQEDILYSITLRQDELGRQPTNMLLEKVVDSPIYQPMIDHELLTYEVYDYGGEGAPKVASLIVTLKGTRYCIVYGDEISKNRRVNAAGAVRN